MAGDKGGKEKSQNKSDDSAMTITHPGHKPSGEVPKGSGISLSDQIMSNLKSEMRGFFSELTSENENIFEKMRDENQNQFRAFVDQMQDASDEDDDDFELEGPPSKKQKTDDRNIEDLLDDLNSGDSVHGAPVPVGDDAMLDVLVQELEQDVVNGPAIPEKLSLVVNAIFATKIPDDRLKKLDEYKCPSNVTIHCPRVELGLWPFLSAGARSTDIKVQKIGNRIVKTAWPIIELAVKLKAIDPELRQVALDALFSLGMALSESNQLRRDMIKPGIADEYKSLCTTAKDGSEFLFGGDLGQKAHDISESAKLGLKMTHKFKPQRQTNSKPFLGRGRFSRKKFRRPDNFQRGNQFHPRKENQLNRKHGQRNAKAPAAAGSAGTANEGR